MTAEQARSDFAPIESDLEFLLQRISRLPTASDLWRVAMLAARRYFPMCGY